MRFEFEGSEARVSLIGEFTFTDYAMFREILSRLTRTRDTEIAIDLSRLDFVDSAALGMLLIARDEVEKANCSLTLVRPQKQVDRVFAVTKFDTLFTIER